MNKKIYFISAFFPSFAGGAEKSILEEFKLYKENGFLIKVISFDILYDGPKFYDFGAVCGNNHKLHYGFLLSISRLAYLFVNRRRVKRILNKQIKDIIDSDFVVLQGPYSPYIAKFCRKHKIAYHYYLRDNSSINIFTNYVKGVKRFLKYIKSFIELPFIIDFKINNTLALKYAKKIIANSDKMAELLHKRIGIKAHKVIYPKINIKEIRNIVLDPKKQKYVTFIGGRNSEKAYEMFLQAAKQLPNYDFLFVEKRDDIYRKGNITYMPQQKDVAKIYEISKVVTSISRWNNTFSGRVGLEAGRLGIPVISSCPIIDKCVDGDKVYVLKDLDSTKEWIKAITFFEKCKGIYMLNSDFGMHNTIGARAYHIYKKLPENSRICFL